MQINTDQLKILIDRMIYALSNKLSILLKETISAKLHIQIVCPRPINSRIQADEA